MAGKAKKSLIKSIKNPLEAIGEFGDPTGIAKGVGKSFRDEAINGAGDFLEFMGLNSKSTGEHLSQPAAQEIDIVNFKQKSSEKYSNNPEQQTKSESRVEAAIGYHRDIVKTSEISSTQELRTISTQIQEIKAELIALANSTKILQTEIASVSVEQSTTQVGIYHAHFFEWMLGMLKAARERVESSEAWMNANHGKQGKKGYWGMFKKHGTQFGLSNERAVATQVG
jgi:hypothetical protein